MPIKVRPTCQRPDGFQIFENQSEVAGVHYHKDDAIAFILGKYHRLEWEREPNNPHDANAIKIIGVAESAFGEERWHIGYVRSDVAAHIVTGGWFESMMPEAVYLTISDDYEFVHVHYIILGPQGQKKQYASS